MATLVSFHAHPDDEAIATGGTLARAAAEGHRVVLVVATGGDGEVPEDLAPARHSSSAARRETEHRSPILGVHRVVWLGYADSGMTGWEQNADPTRSTRRRSTRRPTGSPRCCARSRPTC